MEKKESNNKTINTVIGLIIVLTIGVLIIQCDSKPSSLDNSMMRVASEINKTCPIMVDQNTRLDNVISLPNNIFHYNYTLVNVIKDSIDLQAFEQLFEESVKPKIIIDSKTNPDLREFREKRQTLEYSYKDKNGNFISKFIITADEYTE